jgi:hypothetical protein
MKSWQKQGKKTAARKLYINGISKNKKASSL